MKKWGLKSRLCFSTVVSAMRAQMCWKSSVLEGRRSILFFYLIWWEFPEFNHYPIISLCKVLFVLISLLIPLKLHSLRPINYVIRHESPSAWLPYIFVQLLIALFPYMYVCIWSVMCNQVHVCACACLLAYIIEFLIQRCEAQLCEYLLSSLVRLYFTLIINNPAS